MALFLFGARYPGFNMLKLRARSGMPVAFADFEVMQENRYYMLSRVASFLFKAVPNLDYGCSPS